MRSCHKWSTTLDATCYYRFVQNNERSIFRGAAVTSAFLSFYFTGPFSVSTSENFPVHFVGGRTDGIRCWIGIVTRQRGREKWRNGERCRQKVSQLRDSFIRMSVFPILWLSFSCYLLFICLLFTNTTYVSSAPQIHCLFCSMSRLTFLDKTMAQNRNAARAQYGQMSIFLASGFEETGAGRRGLLNK